MEATCDISGHASLVTSDKPSAKSPCHPAWKQARLETSHLLAVAPESRKEGKKKPEESWLGPQTEELSPMRGLPPPSSRRALCRGTFKALGLACFSHVLKIGWKASTPLRYFGKFYSAFLQLLSILLSAVLRRTHGMDTNSTCPRALAAASRDTSMGFLAASSLCYMNTTGVRLGEV